MWPKKSIEKSLAGKYCITVDKCCINLVFMKIRSKKIKWLEGLLGIIFAPFMCEHKCVHFKWGHRRRWPIHWNGRFSTCCTFGTFSAFCHCFSCSVFSKLCLLWSFVDVSKDKSPVPWMVLALYGQLPLITCEYEENQRHRKCLETWWEF